MAPKRRQILPEARDDGTNRVRSKIFGFCQTTAILLLAHHRDFKQSSTPFHFPFPVTHFQGSELSVIHGIRYIAVTASAVASIRFLHSSLRFTRLNCYTSSSRVFASRSYLTWTERWGRLSLWKKNLKSVVDYDITASTNGKIGSKRLSIVDDTFTANQLIEQRLESAYRYPRIGLPVEKPKRYRATSIYSPDMTPDLTNFKTPVERQHFNFQILTTPTSDTPGTTISLHFNNKRYLIGRVAEGTQRAITERGISLKKTRNIFLTGETKWKYNSGLLGTILTMADVVTESAEEFGQSPGVIKILGGPKIWHSIACARRFIFRTGMPLRVYEANADSWRVSEQPDFYDENVLIRALPVVKGSDRNALVDNRSGSPTRLVEEQKLRQKTVHDMFDSDWKKDRLYESVFKEVNLPAMVWVRDAQSKDLQATFCTKLEDAPHIKPDETVFVRMPWPAALVTELPPADNLPSSVAMSYFVKGRPQRGVFMPRKAKELGIPNGPLYGELARGQTVTLGDGRVIKPEDVLDDVLPGPGMAILDIPHVDYLPDLQKKLLEMQDAGVLTDTHAFIWILDSDILHTQAFANFRNQFPNVKHIVSATDDTPDYIAMRSSAASATRLNHIRPETFPIPNYNDTIANTVAVSDDIVRADRGMVLHAAPKFEIARDNIPEPMNMEDISESISDMVKFLVPADTEKTTTTTGNFDDVVVSTLGTGSAMPSKYRNVSANLIHVPSLGYFIFDAGENTWGQLKRSHNAEELEEIFANLHMIWISHLHADHHVGTISLLVEREKVMQNRRANGQPLKHNLYLVSERNMADYLEDYKSIEQHNTILLRCLNSELTDLNGKVVDLEDTTLPITKLATTRVSHCHGAQAISVTFSNGFKISYSGDCRPSAHFADIGKDSDILIHEATFDDGLEGDAMAKKHSTIGEALGVAVAMKAKNVILTHFSQRYQKLPLLKNVKFPNQINFEEGNDATDAEDPLEELSYSSDENAVHVNYEPIKATNGMYANSQTSLEAAAQQMSVCIAFDLMRVTIPQIKDMYKYYPAIETMFAIEQEKSDGKRMKLKAEQEKRDQLKVEATEAKRKAFESKQSGGPKKKKDKKTAKGWDGTVTKNGAEIRLNLEE